MSERELEEEDVIKVMDIEDPVVAETSLAVKLLKDDDNNGEFTSVKDRPSIDHEQPQKSSSTTCSQSEFLVNRPY